jgi:hypothetical protein
MNELILNKFSHKIAPDIRECGEILIPEALFIVGNNTIKVRPSSIAF